MIQAIAFVSLDLLKTRPQEDREGAQLYFTFWKEGWWDDLGL
jgi:hypothetical protein